MRRTRVFETRDSDWKKKKNLLGRVGKNALFQADCLLCFLSVHTSGTRVFETRDLDWKFFFFFFFLLGRASKNALFQADCLLCFLSVHTSGTRVSLEIFFFP